MVESEKARGKKSKGGTVVSSSMNRASVDPRKGWFSSELGLEDIRDCFCHSFPRKTSSGVEPWSVEWGLHWLYHFMK